jgi:hypothetical protein
MDKAIDKLRTASPPPVYLISTEPTCPATITLLYAEGVLRTRKWQDKGGNDRWTTEIVLSGYSAVLQVIDKKEQEVKEPPKVEDADNNSAAEQVPDDADILQ